MKKQVAFFLHTLNLILPAFFLNAQQPRLMLPFGHTRDVRSASFSPDGKWVVTASLDGTVKIWNAASGELITDVKGQTNGVMRATFSPAGKSILTSAYNDYTAKVWDVATGQLTVELKGHNGTVNSAAFSPDGKSVVTASSDGTAKVWNAATGQLVVNVTGHTGIVNTAVFSPDGKSIATASYDYTAKVWNAANGQLKADVTGHSFIVSSTAFSPDGKLIVTASEDSTARVWNAVTGKLIAVLKGHADEVSNAAFSPDGKLIVTNSSDSSALVWNAATAQLITKFRAYSSAFSPDGKSIVTAYRDTIKIWNTATWQMIADLKGHTDDVNSAEFSPDGKLIVTASGDRTAKVWNASTGQLNTNLTGHTYYVNSVAFSWDGKFMVTVLDDNTLKVLNVATGRLVSNLKGHSGGVFTAAFSPDGKLIVTASADTTAKVWNAATGQLIVILKGHTDGVTGAAFSPDGKWIVTASLDHKARIWNATTGHLLTNLKGHTNALLSAAFSSDSKFVVTGSADHTAKVWNAATGKLIANLKGHTGDVYSAVFSPDRKWVVTASEDRTAKVWNALTGKLQIDTRVQTGDVVVADFSPDGKSIVMNCRVNTHRGETLVSGKETFPGDYTAMVWNIATKQLLADCKGHSDYIYSVVFSPDGKRIATASADNTARIWNAANGTLIKTVRADKNEIFAGIDFDNNRLTCVRNSEISFYDIASGKKIYTSISIGSTDYLNQISSGYYMCSPNAARLLHYVTKDLKVIAFAQWDIKYNRPDKVLEQISYPDTALISSYRNVYCKRIKKLSIDTTAFREGFSVPEADFTNRVDINNEQSNETLQLSIHGKDSTYLLDRFNVWINEVPLFGVRGINIKRRNSNSFDTAITVTLSQGANQIETSITNINGTESYRMPLLVKYMPMQPAKERTYFIGIGINHFADNNYNLQWSVKDIRDLAAKLKEKYKDAIEIDTLFDENVTVAKVVALKKELLKSSINDKVIIAYSGHGLLSSGYDYYLSTWNVNFNHPEQNGLPYDELDNLLDSIPARKKLMLIDACHSGEVDKEEMQQYQAVKNKLDSLGIQKGVRLINKDSSKIGMKGSVELMQELFVNVGKTTGATIISAAAGTQFALEKNNLQNGVFTYCLLEYMQQHEHATINELKQYVNQRVTELTAGMQVPTTRNENIKLNWEVW